MITFRKGKEGENRYTPLYNIIRGNSLPAPGEKKCQEAGDFLLAPKHTDKYALATGRRYTPQGESTPRFLVRISYQPSSLHGGQGRAKPVRRGYEGGTGLIRRWGIPGSTKHCGTNIYKSLKDVFCNKTGNIRNQIVKYYRNTGNTHHEIKCAYRQKARTQYIFRSVSANNNDIPR